MPQFVVRKHTVESQVVTADTEEEACDKAHALGAWEGFETEIEAEEVE